MLFNKNLSASWLHEAMHFILNQHEITFFSWEFGDTSLRYEICGFWVFLKQNNYIASVTCYLSVSVFMNYWGIRTFKFI